MMLVAWQASNLLSKDPLESLLTYRTGKHHYGIRGFDEAQSMGGKSMVSTVGMNVEFSFLNAMRVIIGEKIYFLFITKHTSLLSPFFKLA